MSALVPSPSTRARLVILAGLCAIAVAAQLWAGWAAALLTGGVEAVVFGLAVMDEDNYPADDSGDAEGRGTGG